MDETPKKKLLNQMGNIPAGEKCPYHEKCAHVETTCTIKHEPTPVEMSCAMARLHEMLDGMR